MTAATTSCIPRAQTQMEPSTLPRPNIGILSVPGAQSRTLKRTWHAALDQALLQEGVPHTSPPRDKLCQICIEAPWAAGSRGPYGLTLKGANRKIGRRSRNHLCPAARFPVRSPTRQDDLQAAQAHRDATKRRKLTRRCWKWEWVDADR